MDETTGKQGQGRNNQQDTESIESIDRKHRQKAQTESTVTQAKIPAAALQLQDAALETL